MKQVLEIINELKATTKTNEKLSILTKEEILNEMGFPSNWRTLDSL